MTYRVTLPTGEALLRLGTFEAGFLPEMEEEIRPVLIFGDLSELIPAPQAPRALAMTVVDPPAANLWAKWHFTCHARGGVFIEALVFWTEATIGHFEMGAGTWSGLTSQGVVQLGGPNVVSTWFAGSGTSPGALEVSLPRVITLPRLKWFLGLGESLRFAYSEDNQVAAVGLVWREFRAVPAPDPEP